MNNSNISTVGLLGVVFVTLKLTGVVDWSWWWVTLPFWGGFALVISIYAVGVVGLFGVTLARSIRVKRNKK